MQQPWEAPSAVPSTAFYPSGPWQRAWHPTGSDLIAGRRSCAPADLHRSYQIS